MSSGIRSYPKEIYLKDVQISIKSKREIIVDGAECRGAYCPSERVIEICTKMSKLETFKTLLHEALHGIEDVYEMKIPHALIEDLEEPLADFLMQNIDAIKAVIASWDK